MQRKEFADYWAIKWCDLLRVKSEYPINLWPAAVEGYHHWIRTSIKENLPYDRFVRTMLTASGSNFSTPPVNFYRAVQSREPIAWAAHGLFYGVPSDVDARIASGCAVVCNVSRAVVADVRARYQRSLVVLVTARPETLAARLAARGREGSEGRRARLERAFAPRDAFEPDATIDNDGALDGAVARLCDLVALQRWSARP